MTTAIDIRSAFESPPPDLDFIWPGFLAGSIGGLVAPGGTGKSYWGLQAAMSIACHLPGGDLLNLTPCRTGRVLYLAGEDPAPALIQRIHSIGKHLPLAARASIAINLSLEPITGGTLDVMNPRSLANLEARAQGFRLIVLDTLSRIHQLEENSNSDMCRVIGRLESLAANTGAAVLYLHHTSKTSTREGLLDQQQAARGASALIDNARWCGFLVGMSQPESTRLSARHHDRQPIGSDQRRNFVRLGVSKLNYALNCSDQWYERREGGVLVPVDLVEVSNGKKGGSREQA
ncbi:TPA: AAA family ATPase [Pseudomonas aeruginosa]|nr:AAA family ATPase [Pseudomonas aeruginosa]HEJ1700508.1 AAA family ATPase [Pseudomonas aeruginosa]